VVAGAAHGLGEVPADLALDADGHPGPAHVGGVHPVGQVVQAVFDVGADPGLGQGPGELLGRGLGGVPGDRVQGLQEREAGREAGGDQGQHIGQLRLELACTPFGGELQEQRRHDQPDHDPQTGADQHRGRAAAQQDHAAGQTDHDGHDPKDGPLPRAQRQVGPFEELLGSRCRGPLVHHLLAVADQGVADRGYRRGRALFGANRGRARDVPLDRLEAALAARPRGRRAQDEDHNADADEDGQQREPEHPGDAQRPLRGGQRGTPNRGGRRRRRRCGGR